MSRFCEGGATVSLRGEGPPLPGHTEDHPGITYLLQGSHTAWVPPAEKVPGGQSSHTVSCHSVPEKRECQAGGSSGLPTPGLCLGLCPHRVLGLTCLLHPLAWSAVTVVPALSTIVPVP